MAQSTVLRLRGIWLQVHKWIGLLLALIIIPITLSGSALVWHDGLEEMLHPGRFAVSGGEPTLPLIGHHSHSPVRQETDIATPTQPTICRPTPGTVRLPCRPWRKRTAPSLLPALSRIRASAGSSQTLVRAGRPAPGEGGRAAATITGPSPFGKAIEANRSPGASTWRAAAA